MYGYPMAMGGLLMVLFWVFVLAGIVWLALALNRSRIEPRTGQSAIRILEKRMAQGEIDAEEFKLRRAAIEGGAS